jgi:hypothetical protein
MLFAKAVVLTDVTSKVNHLGERQKIYNGHGKVQIQGKIEILTRPIDNSTHRM